VNRQINVLRLTQVLVREMQNVRIVHMKVHMFVNVSKAMSEMDELVTHNSQFSLLKHPNNPILEVVLNQPS
jgi:hypothetical protein